MENKLLWSADKSRKINSNIKKFSDKISQKYKINFNDDFLKLYNWSIKNPENFWSEYWDYSNIIGNKGNQIIDKDKAFYKNKFYRKLIN